MKLQTLQILQIFIECHGRWRVGAHIQAFTFSILSRSRSVSRCTYPSIHFSLEDTLKITVGCRLCAYPSIHFFCLKITVGCLASAYPSIHTKTLRITVGCPPCTYPSIHVETLRITVGCLWSTYPSIRNKNLHTCWTPWSTQETRGLWARPPVLTPVPSQAIHSRACLNLHLCDIQGTAQKSPCVNTFFEAIEKKKNKETFLSLSGSLGRTPTDTTTERHDTRTTDT